MNRNGSLWVTVVIATLVIASGEVASAGTSAPVVGGVAEVQKPYLDSGSTDPGYSRWVASNTLGVPVVVEAGGFTQSEGAWARTDLSATADALHGILRTRFTLTSLGVYDDRSQVDFTKTVRIGAGTSGLPEGAPITLNVLLQVQGSSHAGPPGIDPSLPQSTTDGRDWYARYRERYLSSTDVIVDYSIRDLSAPQLCEEGCGAQSLLGFGYSAHVLYDTFYGAEVNASWTTGAQPYTRLSGTLLPQSYNGDTNIGYFGAFGWADMDTGVIQLQIDTQVGNFLEMSGSIATLLQTNGMKTTAQAVVDFGHTFDVDLRSTVAGVQIEGEVPTITAVPEPATLALWGFGLLGVLLAVRRRMRISM